MQRYSHLRVCIFVWFRSTQTASSKQQRKAQSSGVSEQGGLLILAITQEIYTLGFLLSDSRLQPEVVSHPHQSRTTQVKAHLTSSGGGTDEGWWKWRAKDANNKQNLELELLFCGLPALNLCWNVFPGLISSNYWRCQHSQMVFKFASGPGSQNLANTLEKFKKAFLPVAKFEEIGPRTKSQSGHWAPYPREHFGQQKGTFAEGSRVIWILCPMPELIFSSGSWSWSMVRMLNKAIKYAILWACELYRE